MAVKVVDVSAIAAVLFGEADTARIAVRIEGHELVAPALFGFELANVCAMKCRRNPEVRDALEATFALRQRLGVREVGVDLEAIVHLAGATGLTGYDASYLWLARARGLELVTLDRQLERAFADRAP